MAAPDGQAIRVLDKYFACHVCGGVAFYRREVKLQTTGMTFFDLDWLNRSADGAICAGCGYVHLFAGDAHEWN